MRGSSTESQIRVSRFRSFSVRSILASKTVNRRQYLATIAAVAGTSIAGCSATTDETVLEVPTEQQDGDSVYYRYEHEGTEVLRVSFNTPSGGGANQQVRAYIEQPADTVLTAYRFRFKSDPSSITTADIYLRPPMVGHADEFDTYRDNDWAVVEGEYEDDRRVTTRFDMLVVADPETDSGFPPLLIDYEVILSDADFLDDRFIARDQHTLEF